MDDDNIFTSQELQDFITATFSAEPVAGTSGLNSGRSIKKEISSSESEYKSPTSNSSGKDVDLTPVNSRKRQSRPENWTQNKRKENRNSGKTYMSVRNVEVAARCLQPVKCSCHYTCTMNFTTEERQEIFNSYWVLDYGAKRNFIDRTVTTHKARKQQYGNSKRKISYRYSLNGKRVCKQFYLKTLNIAERTVYYTKSKDTGVLHIDCRGGPRNHTIPKETKNIIRQHIQSFSQMESDYAQQSRSREYLDCNLSVARMYHLFCEKYPEITIQSSVYYNIFCREFNLVFDSPKKDESASCTKCKYSGDKSNEMDEKIQVHQANKRSAREHKEKEKVNILKSSKRRCKSKSVTLIGLELINVHKDALKINAAKKK